MIRVLLLTLLLAAPARADEALPSWEAYQADRALRTAWLAWSRGQIDAAEAGARAAAGHTPEAPAPWQLLCGLLVDSQRWDDADGPCTSLRARAPDDTAALLLHSRSALELGRADAARDSALRAAERAEADPAGPLALALVAARLDADWDAVERHLGEAARRDPGRSLAALPTWPGWEVLADTPEFIAALEAVLRRQNEETPTP